MVEEAAFCPVTRRIKRRASLQLEVKFLSRKDLGAVGDTLVLHHCSPDGGASTLCNTRRTVVNILSMVKTL